MSLLFARLFGLLVLFVLPNLVLAVDAPPLPIAETIERIAGDQSAYFVLRLTEKSDGKDSVSVSGNDGKIVLTGSSQSSLGYAFYWYLKNFCHAQFAHGPKNLVLPNPLPIPDTTVHLTAPFQQRYYLNYCTYNYSMSWWTWEDWEQELDYMALHGINMPLAILGYEKVYYNTLARLGYTEQEILNFIPGPGYTAWWLMGNLEGYGGPVTKSWIDQQAELQKKIIARMRALDMEPVYHGFYGMMPIGSEKKFPSNTFIQSGYWGGFERPPIIQPSDTLFDQVAGIYYEELEKLYGEAHYYGGDPFHEGGNKEGVDLAQAGGIIQTAMLERYPTARWVLQNWADNPSDELLDGMQPEHLVILDLSGEDKPGWRSRDCFGDKPWIWGTINNFGNKVGLHGKPDSIALAPIEAINSDCRSNLIGIGAIMEGFDYNPSNYELVYDVAWRSSSPDVKDWFTGFAYSRYGQNHTQADSAWQLMYHSVYQPPSSQEEMVEPLICARPSLNVERVCTWGTTNIFYDPQRVEQAAQRLYASRDDLQDRDTYRYDLVDFTRQALSNYGHRVYQQMIDAYQQQDQPRFDSVSHHFLTLQYDLDSLLMTREEFSLWKWTLDARKKAAHAEHADLFEFNARRLVTLWGNRKAADDLHDYANKLWGGMIKTFYAPRWEMFIRHLSAQLERTTPPGG